MRHLKRHALLQLSFLEVTLLPHNFYHFPLSFLLPSPPHTLLPPSLPFRCLIPVFALGRAQELLLILDEYWAMHPELQDVPIYYASSLAKKCMSVYQTYINAMNDKIKRQINVSNPFVFKHISNLKVCFGRVGVY